MRIRCLALGAVEANYGFLGNSTNLCFENSLLPHVDLVYAKVEEFACVYETEQKELHYMRIGCLAMETVDADFGMLRQSPNFVPEHSFLDHMNWVYVKIMEFGSAYDMQMKEYYCMGIGCSPLGTVVAEFGVLGKSPNLGSEYSLLDHMD